MDTRWPSGRCCTTCARQPGQRRTSRHSRCSRTPHTTRHLAYLSPPSSPVRGAAPPLLTGLLLRHAASPAHTHALIMGPRAPLLLAVAAACSLLAAPPAAATLPSQTASSKTVADVCKGTAYPALCTTTAGEQAKRYPVVEALTVLEMQVDAFAKRTEAARAHVAEAAQTASPAARAKLDLCNSLYLDVLDNLGACRRAIGFKDAVTIRATMGMAAQDMQNCDEQFRQIGEKNPMERFDESLVEMSENCRSLSNMI
ncbi:hypothetical protein SETIT_5G059400v2 [Setaria italica]|uniref:Pectinesterase inhibitor domain-containing protein n=1 Tax=Setaria italica TaxID=4555 RepID=A0A368R1T1_SETIT|nr:hypothetical protein SETIT_5G059400v2 [Setaria italica]